jgi:cytochrome c oxidase cbb3-type subunit III
MRTVRGRTFVALTFLLFSCNPAWAQQHAQKKAKATQEPDSATAGRQIFGSICASCHGLDGKGAERGPDIATRPEVTKLSNQDLLKVLQSGVPGKGMPAFAEFGSAKLSSLVTYLRTLQGKDSAVQTAGDPQLGRELFFGKAGCSTCHMVNGNGGFLGPELSQYGAGHRPAEIRAAIVDPRERANERYRDAEVVAKDGQTYSGMVRNEDNFSLQLQSTDGAFHFLSKSDLTSIHYRKEPLMPSDYGTKLSAAELDALTSYLVKVAQESKAPRSNRKKQGDM